MDAGATAALLPGLLLLPLLLPLLCSWGCARGLVHGLLPERRLWEAEDWSLALLQGGGLGPRSLPPDLPDPDPECRELLLDFARSSAELTRCLVRSARPVRLCQTCYPLFQQVARKMDNISRAVGVGGRAQPGPSAWRGVGGVGIVHCGDLTFPICEKKGLDWDWSLGPQESGALEGLGFGIFLHGCCWASSWCAFTDRCDQLSRVPAPLTLFFLPRFYPLFPACHNFLPSPPEFLGRILPETPSGVGQLVWEWLGA